MRGLARLLLPVVVATLLLVPWSAHAADDLTGAKVVVLLASTATPGDAIEDLQGTVTSTNAQGIFLAAEARTQLTAAKRATAPYKFQVFVPWSSVLYVKVK
jgi:hypothetical protein